LLEFFVRSTNALIILAVVDSIGFKWGGGMMFGETRLDASGDDVLGSADTSLQGCSAWLILTPTPKTIEIPTTPLSTTSQLSLNPQGRICSSYIPQLSLALKKRLKPIRENQSGREEGLRSENPLWHR
jgi:hypothetical protein